MNFHNIQPGTKIAIEDKNIHNEYFYIEAEVLEGITPNNYLITSEGTFKLGENRVGKKPVLIDDRIRDEIKKLQLRKFIHSYLISVLDKLTFPELETIASFVERAVKKKD